MPHMGKSVHPIGGLILTAACTLVTHARGSDAQQPRAVLIHVQDSDPCFDHARFLRDLRSRLPERRLELTKEEAQIEVQVLRHDQDYQAVLVARSRDATTRRRTISSRTCEEAADGIAFITSVALDDPPPALEPPQDTPPAHPPRAARTWEVRAAAGAHWAIAALPKTTVGPLLTIFGGHRRAGWWSPGVELGFVLLPPVHITESAGVARFSLWQFTLDLCPTQARVRALWLRPCAYGTAGRLRSEGKETENGQLRRRPHLTAGAELVMGVDVGRWIDVMVRGSWSTSLIVDSYQFNDEIFYEQSRFSYGLAAQLSVTLF